MLRFSKFSTLALLAACVVAAPRPAHELTAPILIGRDDQYSTQVSFAKTKLTYGSTPIETIFASLNNICTADLGGCDTAQGDVRLVTTATKLYDGRSLPATANIVPTPSAEFPIGNASDFVNAVVQVAKAAQQCTTESWRDIGATRSGLDGAGTASFCTMSDYIQINRVDRTTGETNYLYVAASIQDVQSDTFDWCSLASLAGTISGLFGDAGEYPRPGLVSLTLCARRWTRAVTHELEESTLRRMVWVERRRWVSRGLEAFERCIIMALLTIIHRASSYLRVLDG